MKKGFTLVEIMIVMGIIALLAAIAIPNLLRSRISGQEAAAAAALHKILLAEDQWRIAHGTYANLSQLDDETPPYIDAALASGSKYGYSFSTPMFNATCFSAEAVYPSGRAHAFYIDDVAVLCRSNNLRNSSLGYRIDHLVYITCPEFYSVVGQ